MKKQKMIEEMPTLVNCPGLCPITNKLTVEGIELYIKAEDTKRANEILSNMDFETEIQWKTEIRYIVLGYDEPIQVKLAKTKLSRFVSLSTRYSVFKRQHWRCNSCNDIIKFNSLSNWKGKKGHIDHIHPYSERESYINGSDNINEDCNLQALCEECNFKKGKKQIH